MGRRMVEKNDLKDSMHPARDVEGSDSLLAALRRYERPPASVRVHAGLGRQPAPNPVLRNSVSPSPAGWVTID